MRSFLFAVSLLFSQLIGAQEPVLDKGKYNGTFTSAIGSTWGTSLVIDKVTGDTRGGGSDSIYWSVSWH